MRNRPLPLLKKLLSIDDKNFEAWSDLADIYSELGNWKESINAFNVCTKLQPDKASSYYGIAKQKILLSENKEAIEYLKSSFASNPNIRNEISKDFPELSQSKRSI